MNLQKDAPHLDRGVGTGFPYGHAQSGMIPERWDRFSVKIVKDHA